MEQYLNKITCADCLDVLKQLPDKCVDLVLTDPPYGINVAKNGIVGISNSVQAKDYGKQDWDSKIPDKEYYDEIIRVSKNQIIFGGNYMAHLLPPTSCWIVWDKKNDASFFADCELAWTSFKTAVRIFRFMWFGMLQENMKDKEYRFHPTQKPIELMKWCLEKYSDEGQTVLDCFAGGGGSTLIACKQLGRNFIGIEKEQKYVDIANERLTTTTNSLF